MSPQLAILEATGLLAGCIMVAGAILLTFRPRHYDGYVYPWQFPAIFFVGGATTILFIHEYAIVNLTDSIALTVGIYLTLALGSLGVLYYLWCIYPTTHAPSAHRLGTKHSR